jgi:hypothetical protein
MLRRFVGALLVLLIATPLLAQQGTTELRGRVIDVSGGALPGVSVTVRNQNTGNFRETVSGPDGSFIASSLAPGTYQVVAELQGFKKFDRKDLILEVGKTASIDVKLEVGGIEQTVNVTAESLLVDVTSKEIGGNITSETLTSLPSVNGNFIGFIGLLPGIVPSISTEPFGSDSISVNGRIRATTTRSTAATTTTTSSGSARDAGADADRGDPWNSRSSPTSSTPSSAAPPARS